MIVLFRLRASAHQELALLANVSAHVVIDGVEQPDLTESLNIDVSKEYPTPAT